jgi:hypothetical protein
MRVERWRAKEEFDRLSQTAMDNANTAMDEVVAVARQRCPVGSVSRDGKWVFQGVSFTPGTGKNRGNLVQFQGRRWTGRQPGNLRDTIRRVNKAGSGSIRVYAGSYKIYWAFMIHRGYHDRSGKWHPGIPFLQAPFHQLKGGFLTKIKNG